MRKSIFAKYMITFSLIIIISFSLITFIFTSIVKTNYTNTVDTNLIESVSYLSHEVSAVSAPPAQMKDIIDKMGKSFWNVDRFLIIYYDDDGNVEFTNYSSSQNPDKQTLVYKDILNNADLYHNAKEIVVNETDYLYVSGVVSGMNYHAIGIKTTNPSYPMVFVCSVMDSDTITRSIKTSVFTASLWVILASVIAVNFITERMLRPIRQIKKATTDYAKGNFETRVDIDGKDEIALLGQAFNDMADSLDKTEKMRNAFLANISHDLRTPMTTISGFIDGINSGAIPPEKQPYYLDLISAEIHRLSRLVSSILDVSRLESGERKFVYTDFDVAEVARLILISFEQKIEDKKLDVQFESNDTVMVHADKDAIYQVLYNLCHNAIKFSCDAGKFIIRIEEKEEKVFVSVFDEGQSIAAEDMPFVFDRFYKTDKSRGLDKTGVGLGLYICKSIMDAHKETISVKSTEGKNCEFTFTLTRSAETQKKNYGKG